MDLVKLINRHKELGIADVIDHEKFNLISIVHHSTKIEGSTLTAIETQVLLDEGLTPKGKPISDTLMATDHFAALQFCLQQAREKRAVSIELIQQFNALVVKNTGQTYHTIFGEIDASTGTFRKGNVSAGSTYFPNYDKVIILTGDMVTKVNDLMQGPLTDIQKINLAFDIHYNLVSIHPFYDGNGRTSRLLMNYIQAYYQLPLAIVRAESKTEYIEALIATREKDDISLFRKFMEAEYAALLISEINRFEEIDKPKRDTGFRLLF